jgi:hypothetical protein
MRKEPISLILIEPSTPTNQSGFIPQPVALSGHYCKPDFVPSVHARVCTRACMFTLVEEVSELTMSDFGRLMPVCIFGRAQEAGAVAVVIANHSDLLFNVLGQMRDMKLPGMIDTRA